MIPNKSILLLGQEDGGLATIIPELKELAFSGVLSSNAEKALEVIGAFKNLTLVIVDGAMEGVDRHVLEQIKTIQATLPIIWVNDAGQVTSFADELRPDAEITAPVESAELRITLHNLLFEHYYDAELVKCLHNCSDQILKRFNALAVSRVPFIRTSPRLLGNVGAVLAFAGGGIYGQLSIAGPIDHFVSLHRRMKLTQRQSMPHDGRDLAGEIANQILGEIRREYFSKKGIDFQLTPPFAVGGDNVELEFKGHKPSLVMPFDESENSVYIEFNYEASNTAVQKPHGDPVGTGGEVVFF